jgi:hypothetical protein
MSMIKNCTVVVSNGNVVGMHPTEELANAQALQLAEEWQAHADCGSEVPAPMIAVLSFNSWMQLKDMALEF